MGGKRKISMLLFFGSLAALCMIGFVIGAWQAGPHAFIGRPIWMGRAIVIFLGGIAASAERRQRGGSIDFRGALKVAFGVLAMGLIAEGIMTWLVMNVIDPHFYQRLVPFLLEETQRRYHNIGYSDEVINGTLNDIRTNNQFTAGRIIQGMGPLLLVFGIIAVLIAVTVKSKKRPAPTPPQ